MSTEMTDTDFLDGCDLNGFDMRAFDLWLQSLPSDDVNRETLLLERADALEAWNALHDGWLIARLDALARAHALMLQVAAAGRLLRSRRQLTGEKKRLKK